MGGDDLHLSDVLVRVLDLGGSDLHLTAGIEPSVRINGDLRRLDDLPVMSGDQVRRMVVERRSYGSLGAGVPAAPGEA